MEEDGFNKLPPQGSPGNESYKEYPSSSGNVKIVELARYPEMGNKYAAKARKITGLLVSFVALTALLAASSAAIVPVKAAFSDIAVTETTIDYELAIANYDASSSYIVVVYNDFTDRELPVKEAISSGSVKDLKPGMGYTLAVKKGKMLYARTKVTTPKRKG